MSKVRMRPTFDVDLNCRPPEFLAALEQGLRDGRATWDGRLFGDYAIVRVREEQRQFWSPALHLQTDAGAQGGTRVHGRFSPSSPIWTAFVAIYVLLSLLALAGITYGWVQHNLGAAPTGLWAVPGALALAGFTYGAALIGQGLGAEDMYRMRRFVDEVAARCA